MAFRDLPREAQKAFFAKLEERKENTTFLAKALQVLAGGGAVAGLLLGGKALSKAGLVKKVSSYRASVKASALNQTKVIKNQHLTTMFKGSKESHFEDVAKNVNREIGAWSNSQGKVVFLSTSNHRMQIRHDDAFKKLMERKDLGLPIRNQFVSFTHNHPKGIHAIPEDGLVATGPLSPQDVLSITNTTSGKMLSGTFPKKFQTFKEAENEIVSKVRRGGSTGFFYIQDAPFVWYPKLKSFSNVDGLYKYTISAKGGKAFNELPDRAFMNLHNFNMKYAEFHSKVVDRAARNASEVRGSLLLGADENIPLKSKAAANKYAKDLNDFITKSFKRKDLAEYFEYKVVDTKTGKDVTGAKDLSFVIE